MWLHFDQSNYQQTNTVFYKMETYYYIFLFAFNLQLQPSGNLVFQLLFYILRMVQSIC